MQIDFATVKSGNKKLRFYILQTLIWRRLL
jgi:hypothetical protein